MGGVFEQTVMALTTLPARFYCSAGMFAEELARIHRRAWHPLCHVSELPEPGSTYALDLLGRRVFAVRGEGGAIGVFHNVCRNRAHAVVPQGRSRCARAIVCPYHAWSYGFDGRLKAVASPGALPDADLAALGLWPVPHELFMGFVFFRLEGEGPGVAERLAAAAGDLEAYRIADMVPESKTYARTVAADWKAVWDNYL